MKTVVGKPLLNADRLVYFESFCKNLKTKYELNFF
jgi:hypothetical protein